MPVNDFANPKNNADLVCEHGRLVLSGNLDFANAPQIYQKSLKAMRDCDSLTFDFSQLTSSNSVVLALMVEWLKFSKKHRKPIQFIHLSEKITSIAKVGGLEKLL